jgi:hypothetical protein
VLIFLFPFEKRTLQRLEANATGRNALLIEISGYNVVEKVR